MAVEVQGPNWCLSTSLFTSVYFILLDYSETHRGNQQSKTSLSSYPYVSVGYYFDFQKLNVESRVKSGAGNVLRMSCLSFYNTMEAQHKDLKGAISKKPASVLWVDVSSHAEALENELCDHVAV